MALQPQPQPQPQPAVLQKSSIFWYIITMFVFSQALIIITFHFAEEPSLLRRRQAAVPADARLSTPRLSLEGKISNRNSPAFASLRHPLPRGRASTSTNTSSPLSLSLKNHDPQHTAQQYAKSFTTFGKGPLNFFHIPKTAGTAVEEAAAQQGIPWGSCRFRHKPKREACPYPREGAEWPPHVGWWHLPAYLFPLAGSHPYQSTQLFAVVRDPYDRMVSEFYYICTLKVKDWRPDQCDNRTRLFDPAYMNAWLTRKLQQQNASSPYSSSSSSSTPETSYYLADNSHFTPQYDFLVGPHQVRVVDYVLQLDHPTLSLAQQFERLVQAFGMADQPDQPQQQQDEQKKQRMTLQHMGAISAGERNTTQHLTIQNLSPSTLEWIHRLYADDFKHLGYPQKQELAIINGGSQI